MLVWLQFESLTRKEIPIETLDWLIRNRIDPDTFNFINTRMTVAQIVRYIQRQMEESGMNLRETLTTWSDYLSLAKRLDYPFNNTI